MDPADRRTVTFSAPRGVRLAGTLWRAGAGSDLAGVVLAHGFTSDQQSRGRFPALAQALLPRGLSTLAFDFAGCGQSDDAPLSTAGQVEDLRSAVSFARSQGLGRLAVLGHSLGGLICLRAALPDLATLVLTGTPTGPLRYDWAAIYSKDQLDELSRTGRLLLERSEGPRRRHVVEAGLLRDLEQVDAAALLAGVRCPALLVAGDGDDEERQILAQARLAIPRLPLGSRLELVAGAPHGFGAAWETRVLPLVVEWLERRLAAPR